MLSHRFYEPRQNSVVVVVGVEPRKRVCEVRLYGNCPKAVAVLSQNDSIIQVSSSSIFHDLPNELVGLLTNSVRFARDF